MSLFNKLLNALVPAQPNVDVSPIQPENKYATNTPLFFPSNLSDSGSKSKRYPHFMKFTVREFKGGTTEGDITQQKRVLTDTIKATIFLHIPDNLAQTTSHEYNTESITAALANYGLLGEAAPKALKDAIEAYKASGSIQDFLLTLASSEPGGRVAEQLFGAGKGTTELLLAYRKNEAVNPRYEVLYAGTRPREFTFDFKLSPKNQKEALAILDIIKSFRYWSAPDVLDDRNVIPPNPFQVEFYFGAGASAGTPNLALFKIDNCFLEGVDANYATAGQFATFKDGMPVEIALQLRFKEIQIITKKKIVDGY